MPNKKIRIAIITAQNLATSSDCSPETIINLLNSIEPTSYTTDIVLIDKFIPVSAQTTEEELLKLPMYIPFKKVFAHKNVSHVFALEDLKFGELKANYDVAIVAIYNNLGEDGKILGLLDTLGIPYLGPSLKVSATCFDKSYARQLVSQNGGIVPPGFFIHQNEFKKDNLDALIRSSVGYPVICKAVSSGNSYGLSLIKSENEIEKAALSAFAFSDELLIEKMIIGKQFTVGLVGSYLSPEALPIVQINLSNDIFDYESKYILGKAEEVCPAPIEQDLTLKLQNAAIIAYKAVKCDSHARIDMIYSEDDGLVYVLDINTFPGLNAMSSFPMALKAAGISLSEFIDKQIKLKIYKTS